MYRNTRPTEWLALCRALESEADGFGPLEGASDRIPDARLNCVLGISPAVPQAFSAAGSPAPGSPSASGRDSELFRVFAAFTRAHAARLTSRQSERIECELSAQLAAAHRQGRWLP